MVSTDRDIFLVLGGTGMLGRQIVECLKERGDSVSTFGDGRCSEHLRQYARAARYLEYLRDVTLMFQLQSGATSVFHTASPHATAAPAESFWSVNVEGTRLVIAACREAGVKKLIFTGSAGVIYGGTDVNQADETFPYTTKNMGPNMSSKITAEKAIIEANGQDGLLTTVLRPSSIFGPGDRQMIEVLWNTLKPWWSRTSRYKLIKYTY